MDYSFEIKDVPEQKVLYIAEKVSHKGIGDAFMRILPEVYGYAESSGAQPSGPPFGRYLDWCEADCVLEAGVIVANDVPEHGSVRTGTFGGFKAVVTQHIGPYDGLQNAHSACHQWIVENGMDMAGPPCEVYTMDPGGQPDSSKWETQVVWPIL